MPCISGCCGALDSAEGSYDNVAVSVDGACVPGGEASNDAAPI